MPSNAKSAMARPPPGRLQFALHEPPLLRPRRLRPSRSSARPSARTCAAPSSASATARRSSSAIRTTAPPTASSGTPSRRPRAACWRWASQKGDRVGIWAPNRYEWVVLQYATARIGAILVNINPAYKAHELEYALKQSGVSVPAPGRAASARPTTCRCSTRSAAAARSLREALVLDDDWDAPRLAGRRRCRGASSTQREADAAVRRRHQHPVHLRHDRLPQGRDALAPQHPQQRLLRRPGAALHRARPRLHSGAVLPLLRHGAGQPRLHHATAPAWSCPARRSIRSRSWRRSQAERCTSLYGVPTMFIAELDHPRFAEFDLTSLRTGIMAGAPCPVEVMRQVRDADAHAGGRHRLRHDRDLARLDAERPRRSARAARRHRRPRAAARRDQDRRSGDRRASCRAARAGELCTRGYSVMLGYWNDDDGDARRHRRRPAGCTPATWRRWTTRATSTSSAASRT